MTIALTVAGCPLRSSFEDQVAEHIGTLPAVSKVTLQFDASTIWLGGHAVTCVEGVLQI